MNYPETAICRAEISKPYEQSGVIYEFTEKIRGYQIRHKANERKINLPALFECWTCACNCASHNYFLLRVNSCTSVERLSSSSNTPIIAAKVFSVRSFGIYMAFTTAFVENLAASLSSYFVRP